MPIPEDDENRSLLTSSFLQGSFLHGLIKMILSMQSACSSDLLWRLATAQMELEWSLLLSLIYRLINFIDIKPPWHTS